MKHPRAAAPGPRRLALPALAAAALALLAVAEAGRADDAGVIRLLGKVKSTAEGGAGFELAAKGGPYRVEIGTASAVVLADGVTLVDCDRQEAQLLCKLAPPDRDPKTGQSGPPSYTQILTILVGGPFSPPSDTSGLPAGVSWRQGTFGDNMKQKGLWAGENRLMTGKDRTIWRFAAGKPEDVKKNAIVLIEGEVEKDGKTKVLRPSRIVVLAPNAPTAELKYVFGPTQ